VNTKGKKEAKKMDLGKIEKALKNARLVPNDEVAMIFLAKTNGLLIKADPEPTYEALPDLGSLAAMAATLLGSGQDAFKIPRVGKGDTAKEVIVTGGYWSVAVTGISSEGLLGFVIDQPMPRTELLEKIRRAVKEINT